MFSMFKSIQFKIQVPLFIVLQIGFAVMSYQSYLELRNSTHRQLDEKIFYLSENFAHLAPVYMETREVAQLKKMAEPVVKKNDVLSIRFLAPSGNVIAESSNTTADAFKTYRQPIVLQGQTIGFVEVDYTYSFVNAYIQQRTFYSALLMFAMVFLVNLVIYFILNKIIQPLRTVSQLLQYAAQNSDLTLKTEVNTQDEVGSLAQNFNQFNAQLNALLLQIRQASGVVNGSAGEITQDVYKVSTHLEGQRAGITQILTAVDEASGTLTELDGASANVLAELKSIVEKTNSADRSIQQLAAQSGSITNTVKIIEEIAERTNLLALNAAIEAARAGDAGRGFAVVAEEVKKLADQTVKSTAQIATTIQTLQSEITQTTTQFDEVSKSIRSIEEKMEGVSENTTRQSSTVHQITSTIQEFASQVSESANLVGHTGEVAQSLQKRVKELVADISKFKLG